MSDYNYYKESRQTVDNLIETKMEEIKSIESEIFHLKKVKRMIDEKQFNSIKENKRSDLIG